MSENVKKALAVGVVLFILAILALHSIFTLVPTPKQEPLPLSPVQTTVSSTSAPTPTSNGNLPVVYIPTNEEIKQFIEDQNQKRKAREELMATRNKKTEKVIATATAALSSSASQEVASEKTPSPLSPEARAERNKELRDGIKAHLYFPR